MASLHGFPAKLKMPEVPPLRNPMSKRESLEQAVKSFNNNAVESCLSMFITHKTMNNIIVKRSIISKMVDNTIQINTSTSEYAVKATVIAAKTTFTRSVKWKNLHIFQVFSYLGQIY